LQATYHSHLVILLYAPTLQEALPNFVNGENQLTAHGTCVDPSPSTFKITYGRLCRTTNP
jgi:hypothetical protein